MFNIDTGQARDKLPIEYPVGEALAIYAKRSYLFFAVILLNLVVFGLIAGLIAVLHSLQGREMPTIMLDAFLWFTLPPVLVVVGYLLFKRRASSTVWVAADARIPGEIRSSIVLSLLIISFSLLILIVSAALILTPGSSQGHESLLSFLPLVFALLTSILIWRRVGGRRREGTRLFKIGLLFEKQDQIDEAITHIEEAREIFTEINAVRFVEQCDEALSRLRGEGRE